MSNMGDGSSISNKESDNPFEGSNEVSDANINDLDKSKTKVMDLKMFITISCIYQSNWLVSQTHLSATVIVRVTFILN